MSNSSEYKFFYDEAFHTRKITVKSNVINIYKDDTSDIYVGAFIGFNKDYELTMKESMHNFESKYKGIYGLSNNQELKGTTIHKKNFRFGIASLNNHSLSFYSDYFSLLNQKTHIQVSLLSKTGLLVSQVFSKIQTDVNISKPAFIYSLSKILNNYRLNDLYIKLFDSAEDLDIVEFLNHLITYLKTLIEKGSIANRKMLEVQNFKEILYILETSTIPLVTEEKYSWNYDDVFRGFNSYLRDEHISPSTVELKLDNESKTAESAGRIGSFYSIEECKSHTEMGVRIADILSNFIGRIVWSLTQDLYEPKLGSISDINGYDFENRKLLSSGWFNLTEEKFKLYKQLLNVLINQRQNYWTFCNDEYFDYTALFVSLILYIGGHDSFEDFTCLPSGKHSEQFNNFSTQVIRDRFELLFSY